MLVIVFIILTNWRVKDRISEIIYDFQHGSKEVTSKDEIDAVLGELKQVPFNELSQTYLKNTKSNEPKYQALLKPLSYYKFKRTDLNKRIVGDFRIKDFLCKDDFYINCILKRNNIITAPLNKKLLYKTLELLEALDQAGHDRYAFQLVNGHRHPKYNEQVGGAQLSRHIKGEAVDLLVGDINQDGYVNKADKDIVLELLEHQIIKDAGGIGLYPGTDNIHYDVRGTRARWNSFLNYKQYYFVTFSLSRGQ